MSDEDISSMKPSQDAKDSFVVRQVGQDVKGNIKVQKDVRLNVQTGTAAIPKDLPQGFKNYEIVHIGQTANGLEVCGDMEINLGQPTAPQPTRQHLEATRKRSKESETKQQKRQEPTKPDNADMD